MTFLKNKIKELRRSKRFKDFISFLLIYLILILVFLLSYQFVKTFNNSIANNLNSQKILQDEPVNNIPNNSINNIKKNLSPNIENKIDTKLPLNYSKDIIDEVRDLPKPLNNVYDIDFNI